MISIRKGNDDDIPAIMDMISKYVIPAMHAAGNHQWGEDYPNVAAFQEDVDLDRLYVCITDLGDIVGVGALTTEQFHEYSQCGLDTSIPAVCPHRLAAHPLYAGKGIGRMLMNQAVTVCKEKQIDRIRVDTNNDNETAKKLFCRCGCVAVGLIELDMRPGMQFACYEKIINDMGDSWFVTFFSIYAKS